ncbi:MAG: ankyrin repeat domain-containing protein [Spirochaetaceae bacterium]|jgi:ankyrin repeat protein|nr:ankyrin repeat domain-containing protein [Spirochaetaceae bacterium]
MLRRKFYVLLLNTLVCLFFSSCLTKPPAQSDSSIDKAGSSTKRTSVSSTTEAEPTMDDIWELLAKGDDNAQQAFIGKLKVDITDEQGRTPLHIVVEQGNTTMAAFFISIGAVVDAEDKQGRTPLTIAAARRDTNTAQVLAHAGANIHQVMADDSSPALLALNGQDGLLKALLNPFSIQQKNPKGQTILHLAALVGNALAIDPILAAGVDKAEHDNEGKTALDIALNRTDSLAHAEVVEKLILAGAVTEGDLYRRLAPAVRSSNYNTRNFDGITLLHFTAHEGYSGFVAFLLKKNVDIDAKDSSGSTPLHEATRMGHETVLSLLIEAGADVNAQDAKGNSALHLATPKDQYKDILELLLSHKANPNLRDGHGNSPLHIAIMLNRDPATVKLLLDHGADISIRNIEGKTSLYLAVQDERLMYIALLLEYGANIFAVDNKGTTPFEKALLEELKSLPELITPETVLQADGAGNTLLHIVVDNRASIDIIKLILDKNAALNARNKEGDTALHKAIRQNYQDIGELLLASGADIFTPNAQGESPLYLTFFAPGGFRDWVLSPAILQIRDGLRNTVLHYVVQWQLDDYIQKLILMGADIEAANATGETPLFMAVSKDLPSTTNILIKAGASVTARDVLGNTCLHTAVRWNAQNAASVLIDAGIEINAHAQNGKTALHDAVRLGISGIEAILITHGAALEARDADGNTPLVEAIMAGLPVTVERLVRLGANPNTRNNQGNTPLHSAVSLERSDMVSILLPLGVSIHAKNALGITPLLLALEISEKISRDLLRPEYSTLTNDEGESPLHLAIRNNASFEIINYIVSQSKKIDSSDAQGRSALYLAVEQKRWDIAKLLVNAGANLFFTAGDGLSPADLALSQGNEAINALFNGKAINDKDLYGNTILHYVAQSGTAELASILLGFGADKSIKNIVGDRPADIALRWKQSAVEALLK